MPVESMKCPACGAPVEMARGKLFTMCDFCGTQVKQQLSETEFKSVEKNSEFASVISAAVHCIYSDDYDGAITYADRAATMLPGDPAPSQIKFIAYLDSDFKKAVAQYKIATDMRSREESVALTDEQYRAALAAFVANYLAEKDQDLKRMFSNMRSVSASDIENVRAYEYRKKIEDFKSIPDLDEAIAFEADACMTECEQAISGIGDDQEKLSELRKNNFFKVVSAVFIDPSLSDRAKACLTNYDNVAKKKSGGGLFGRGGSKVDTKQYHAESEVCLVWLRKYF
jgi:hypothetical protein